MAKTTTTNSSSSGRGGQRRLTSLPPSPFTFIETRPIGKFLTEHAAFEPIYGWRISCLPNRGTKTISIFVLSFSVHFSPMSSRVQRRRGPTDCTTVSYVVDVPLRQSPRINLDLFTAFFRRTALEKEIAIAVTLSHSFSPLMPSWTL